MMDRETYIRWIAFFTIVMATIYSFGVTISYSWQMNLPLLLLSFIGSIGCIFIFRASSEPAVSFAGVSGMSILMGLMTGPLVAHYAGPVVLNAIITTAAVMVGMSLLGILYPKSFEGMGPYLFGALLVLILGQVVQMLFVALGFTQIVSMTAFAWLGVLIFTLYVAYDWSQALNQEYTLDNAIDASGGLILDAINLFIDFLQIYSGSND